MISQGFFVYNLAHKNTTIQSLSGGTLRILGLFSTLEEARVCIAKQAAQWPDLETRVSPMHTWRLLSKDLLDVDQQTHQFLDLLDAQAEHRKQAFEEVAKRASQVHEEIKDNSEIESNISESKMIDDCNIGCTQVSDIRTGCVVPEVPRDFEIRLQKFVGIAILPDIQSEKMKKDLSDHEPAFQVLCAAETEDEIEKQFQTWSERYLTDDIRFGLFSSVPLACVSMQETFRPAWALSVSTRRVTRDERLAQIREAFERAKDSAEIA